LLEASDLDLLRPLNVGAETVGTLTTAGSLFFVGTPEFGIDCIRRGAPGTDSTNRVRSSRPLLEQVFDAVLAIRTANRVMHSGTGLTQAQTRGIPQRATREAMVNGVTHRDWLSPPHTTIEHVGEALTVTSPAVYQAMFAPTTSSPTPRCPATEAWPRSWPPSASPNAKASESTA